MNGDEAMARPTCEHLWVSKHQSDFPAPIYWVGVCSLCGDIDGQMLADQVRAAGLLREDAVAHVAVDNDRDAEWCSCGQAGCRKYLNAGLLRANLRAALADPPDAAGTQ